MRACKNDPAIVDLINKYLLGIVVKQVRVNDFRPKTRTLKRDQINDLVLEFKRFLEEQFEDGDYDSRQMLYQE